MGQYPKILAVDDEPYNVQIIRELLGDHGEVRTCFSGDEALLMVASYQPDIVYMDVTMPGRDGYLTCREMRKMPALKGTKIVLVSGRSSIEEKLKGYHAGADDFVTKPYVPEELLAKTKVYLRLAQAERELSALNENLEKEVHLRTAQLLRAEKLAFLGTHTAEIIHNLKSPLAILKGMVYLMLKRGPSPEVEKMDRAIDRLEQTVRTIINTGRSGLDEESEVALGQVIADELQLLEADHFFLYKVSLEMETRDLPTVRGQRANFGQIFGNLIRNAVDSMYDRPERKLSIIGRRENDAAVVTISDTGCGIAEPDLAKIFDPFYTTKPLVSMDGEPSGTGLGLSSVKRMVEAYGGNVSISSEQGVGTAVRVAFPLHEVKHEAFNQAG